MHAIDLVRSRNHFSANGATTTSSMSLFKSTFGGLHIFDNRDPKNPKFVKYVETGGLGVHRPIYDGERKLLYSSSDHEGFQGMILFVHDMKEPWSPELIGLGWVPDQYEAGGEVPEWDFPPGFWGVASCTRRTPSGRGRWVAIFRQATASASAPRATTSSSTVRPASST